MAVSQTTRDIMALAKVKADAEHAAALQTKALSQRAVQDATKRAASPIQPMTATPNRAVAPPAPITRPGMPTIGFDSKNEIARAQQVWGNVEIDAIQTMTSAEFVVLVE